MFDKGQELVSLNLHITMESASIYKFFGQFDRVHHLLIHQQLYFTNPEHFNDPFDCNFQIRKDYTLEELIPFYEKTILEQHGDVIKLIDILREEIYLDRLLTDQHKAFKDHISQFAVCCFTAKISSLLMWAHYANCHKGLCLEFDYQSLDNHFYRSYIVNYEEQYPIIDPIYNMEDALRKYISVKSVDWRYEFEMRFVEPSSGQHSFPIKSLKKIHFGAKASPSEISHTMLLLEALKLDWVECYQLKISKTAFELSEVEVKFEKPDSK